MTHSAWRWAIGLAAVVAMAGTGSASARIADRANVDRSTANKATATPISLVSLSNAYAHECCEPEPSCCCPQPCITYCERGCRRVCCDCKPPVRMVLKVKNPQTCCTVDVPICVPACCCGEPEECDRCGLFCRGIVNYRWCCGFRVRVTFTGCGDIRVTYFGL